MFTLDGNPLALDAPFIHNDISYPANWLRLASPDEREAIGIEEVPDPPYYDQRFYWGPDLPMDHSTLINRWVSQTKVAAGAILAPSDWMIIRELDNNTSVPTEWRTWRESIRVASSEKIASIEQTVDTDELCSYINSAEYHSWPEMPQATV